MEYRHYRAGKKISRDDYIASGLERGKLLIKEACGCVVIQDRTADAYIVYCSKHKAASDTYTGLKDALQTICKLCVRLNPQHEDCESCEEMERSRQPLAKAEGSE